MSLYSLNNEYIFLFYEVEKKQLLYDELLKAVFLEFKEKLHQIHIDVEEILQYAFNWCADRLVEFLNTQTELRFYQALFLLHESSCHYSAKHPKKSPIPEKMDVQDYAIYRRALKLCLEHACELNLSSENKFTPSYLNEIDAIAEDVLYWGVEAYNFSNMLAEEKMYKGTIAIKIDNENKIFFRRNSYIHFKQLEMSGDQAITSLVATDEKCFSDFVLALKNCMEIEYEHIRSVIWMIHDHNEKVGGQLVLCNWALFPNVLEEAFGVSQAKGAVFFRGITLDRENKLSTKDAIYKSDSLYRSLYRPMLTWTVDGKAMTILGESAFDHAIISLCTNALAWGKYPKEWKSDGFEKFIASKKEETARRLEDAIENILKENDILYDRNIKFLRKWNNMNLDINNTPGEIDFLFLCEGRLYIADSKHHLERFDANSFRSDYTNFECIYNVKLSKKIDFLSNHIDAVEEHFQIIQNDVTFKLTNKDKEAIEGIFIINLPTYVMQLNLYRIVTLFGLLQLINKGATYKSFEFSITPNKNVSLNIFYDD